mgnify:CR=1 FL=1
MDMDYLDHTLVNPVTPEDILKLGEVAEHLERLPNWELYFDDSHGYFIKRVLKFNDADKARRYIGEIKELAEEMHTIPSIQLKGTDVEVICNSHELNGLHLNDMIMAAHVDSIFDRWDIISGERDKVTQASDESFPASDPPGY